MIASVTGYRPFNRLAPLDRIQLAGHGLWIAGLALAASSFGRLTSGLLLVLVAWWALVGLIGLTQASGRMPRCPAWILAALDLAFATSAYLLSGVFGSPISSAFLIAVFAAGLGYGWFGVLGAGATVVVCVTTIGLVVSRGGLWVMIPTGMVLQGLAVSSAVIGWLSDRIYKLGEVAFHPGDAARRRGAGRSPQQMFAIAAQLNATLEFEQVLDLALDLSASVLADANGGRDHLILALFLQDGSRFQVAAARRLPRPDSESALDLNGGLLERALAEGKTQRGRDPATDPALRQLEGLHTCRDLLAIPLVSNGEVSGVLLCAHPRQGFFNNDQADLLEAAARQVAVALHNARLFQDLEAERERMTEIQEEARRKLARDLHDGPTQSIAAITMRVNFARRLIERDAQAASTELTRVEDLARRTTKDLRHMLFTLRPLILESQGLLPALKQLAEKTRDTHGQDVIVQAKHDVAEGLEPGKQAVIFYIAEEAVNNARKHAEAEHIWVRLNKDAGAFTLEVEDDGVGFNVGAVDSNYEQRGSLGMVNMRERTELVAGKLIIRSAEGKGTLITVVVPVPSVNPDSEDRREPSP